MFWKNSHRMDASTRQPAGSLPWEAARHSLPSLPHTAPKASDPLLARTLTNIASCNLLVKALKAGKQAEMCMLEMGYMWSVVWACALGRAAGMNKCARNE